jgi:hypothetical protein
MSADVDRAQITSISAGFSVHVPSSYRYGEMPRHAGERRRSSLPNYYQDARASRFFRERSFTLEGLQELPGYACGRWVRRPQFGFNAEKMAAISPLLDAF